MKIFCQGLLLVCALGIGSRLPAQTSLNKLEDQVRGATTPAAPLVLPPGAEPGYVGLIADERKDSGGGIRVRELVAGGPAQQSGLQAGDVIGAVNGQPVATMDDFGKIVSASAAGTKLSLQVERAGKAMPIELTLGRRPPPGERRFEFGAIPEPAAANPNEPRMGLLGVRIATVTPQAQTALSLPAASGALVVGIVDGSAAQKAGLGLESVIVSVDGQPVHVPADLSRLITAAGPGREVKLTFYHRGELHERGVTLEAFADSPPPTSLQTGPSVPTPAPVVVGGPSEANRVQALELRVLELERRLADLEKRLSSGK